MGRIAALDYGQRRIGVALTDPDKIIATPFDTISTGAKPEETAKRLAERLRGYDLESIVIGLPLRLNGKTGTLHQEIATLIPFLESAFGLPVVSYDERLTTSQADRSLREGGLSRKQRAALVDKVSASLLLRSYLDRLAA